jgi:hypothetical protein
MGREALNKLLGDMAGEENVRWRYLVEKLGPKSRFISA